MDWQFDNSYNGKTYVDEDQPSGQQRKWNNNNNWKRKKEEGPFELYKPCIVYGNSDMPASYFETIKSIVSLLNTHGFTLRTLGETDSDNVVESVAGKKEVYIPWKGFNEKETKFYFSTEKSLAIAKLFMDPDKFDSMKPSGQKFRSRNVRAVLGDKINSPAMFILGWSEDGAETAKERTNKSGTLGNLIMVAESMKIPVFNLKKEDSVTRLKNYFNLN